MKLRVLVIALTLSVLTFITGIAYAADGNRFVNGNLGVGTTNPQGKAEVKKVVNSDRNLGVDIKNPAGKDEINDKKVEDGNPGDGAKTPAEKEETKDN